MSAFYGSPDLRTELLDLFFPLPREDYRPQWPLLHGIELRASKHVPATATRTVVAPDWRERLARNLSRPSTGRWEPLEVTEEVPVVWYVKERSMRVVPDLSISWETL